MLFTQEEIQETIRMIEYQKFDIRTITMGISLLDCCDTDSKQACRKIYDKICRYARDLVKTGNDIESEFGVPVIKELP